MINFSQTEINLAASARDLRSILKDLKKFCYLIIFKKKHGDYMRLTTGEYLPSGRRRSETRNNDLTLREYLIQQFI